MRQLAKKLARLLFGNYSVYYIYACRAGQRERLAANTAGLRFAPVDRAQVESSKHALMADQSGYHGSNTHAYACFEGASIVGLCYFWHGGRYRRERNFWPLEHDEAKLVQIVVIPSMRGRAVATNLIACAGEDMFQKGFRCLYARIWHSNRPSWRAFQRAGWTRVAMVIDARPLPLLAPLRVVFGRKRIPRFAPAAAREAMRQSA